MPRIDSCVKNTLARLFPPSCLLCGGPARRTGLCAACTDDLPRPANRCVRCGGAGSGPGPCGPCLRHAPPVDCTIAAFSFAPPVDHWVRELKYHHRLHYARILGELLADELEARAEIMPDLILPVPLHAARLRRRGFNQAVEIARPIARRLECPLAYRMARRVRDTPSQAELPLNQRRRNLNGAFRCSRARVPAHLAIVDDVVTSGATVHTLARVLRAHGARHIQIWAAARTDRAT